MKLLCLGINQAIVNRKKRWSSTFSKVKISIYILLFRDIHTTYASPSLGVKSELQLTAYATARPDPSHIYPTLQLTHGRSLTHLVRPGIKPSSSWILPYCWVTTGPPLFFKATPMAYGSSWLQLLACNTRSVTHWARPRTERASSWILLGFLTH